MPVSIATKLGIQFARFAAASGNAGSASIRNAFSNATAGSSTSASSSSWAQGLSSGGSAANGAGIGGAKFQAGRGAHSTFSQSGRAIVNANASSSQDAANNFGDDEEELAAQQARIHRPGHLHRSGLLGRSWSQSPIRSSKKRQNTTTLPALQLILPKGTQLVHSPSQSPRHSRTLTSSAPANELVTDSVRTPSDQDAPLSLAAGTVGPSDARQSSSVRTGTARRQVRSHSVGASAQSNEFDSADALDILDALRKKPESTLARPPQRSAEEDDHAAKVIEAATNAGDWMAMLEAVRQYCRLDRSQQSVHGFNLALEALLKIRKDQRDPNAVLSCYLQMTESGFRPDARTFSAVVTALCRQDESLQALHRNERKPGVHAGEEFAHAMSLFNLAHAAHLGFINTVAYNYLLRGCGHRGDVRQARIVLENLIGMIGLRTSARTFSSLLDCVSHDTKMVEEEDQASRSKRILKSCQKIFDEFQARRNEGAVLGNPVLVWNAMIRASFDHNDATKALRLIDEMLKDSNALERQTPPYPDRTTSSIVITRLAKGGDLASSLDWIERLFILNKGQTRVEDAGDESALSEEEDLSVVEPAKGSREMPLPDLKSLIHVLNLATTVPGQNVTSTQSWGNLDRPMDVLDHSFKVNTVINLLFESFGRSDSVRIADSVTLASVLKRNLVWQDQIIRENLANERSEKANTLLDSTLATIRAFFNIAHAEVDNESLRAVFMDMLPAVLGLVDITCQQLRIEDSASLFTYAIQCQLRGFKEAPKEGSPAWSQTSSVLTPRFKKLAHLRQANEDSVEIGIRPFVQTMEVMLPAMSLVNLTCDPSDGKRLLTDYSFARLHFSPSDLPLSASGWKTFLRFLTLFEQQMDVPLTNGALSVLSDVVSLPEEIRAGLDLGDLISLLQSKYPDSAYPELERLGLVAPPRSDESIGSPESTGRTTSTSDLTNMTAESLLEGYVASSSMNTSKAPINILSNLPAVQVVDEDFGIRLQKTDAGLKSRFGISTPPNPKGAYDDLIAAIYNEGRYASVAAISQMLVSAGRAGDVDRAQELYVIGCHVLGSFVGHVEWQAEAWTDLENGMICALAHAGEAKAASEHRHRLINAGRVPSVDAYASLIAVIRDTTDDALIAEELYEESKRLGVEPNVYLYNTVISKLCRARKLDQATLLFNEMRERGLRPSSVTYGSMINGFTRIGDEENAEALFNVMENAPKFRAKAPPYNNMIQFFTYNRPDREKAMMYFNKLHEHQVEPTGYTYKLSLDVHGVIEPVDIPGMERVFGQLIADPTVAVEGNHWGSIISTHGIKAGDLNKAIDIFESIPTHLANRKVVRNRGSQARSIRLPDAVVYEALLNVFLHHGRTDLMRTYVNRMRDSGIQATAYLANVMIKGLAFKPDGDSKEVSDEERSEGLLHARALFAEMDDPPMGVAAVGNHPVNHRHHANDAMTMQQQSMQLPHLQGSAHSNLSDNLYGFKGVLREPSTFETMMRAELQHGNRDLALLLLEKMRSRGYPPALMTKAESLVNQDPVAPSDPSVKEAAVTSEAAAEVATNESNLGTPASAPPTTTTTTTTTTATSTTTTTTKSSLPSPQQVD